MLLKAILIGVVLLAIYMIVTCTRKKPPPEGVDELAPAETLHHTIEVNLGILQRELEQLRPIAAAAAVTPAVERARLLLAEAADVAEDADWQVSVVGKGELPALLEHVFQAMTRTTEARKLLGAFVPYDME